MKTVFWSWQSDLDSRVTRNLIKSALTDAITQLSVDLEEAERPKLTHDTKDVAGTPDIVATILEKIEKAAVFIADVTPIGKSESGKALANPNVLIELGFAKHAIGTKRLILVWNTAFPGTFPEDLPFDLRGKRAPAGFNLEPGASTEELRKARESLTKELLNRLRASLLETGNTIPSITDWHPRSVRSPALWFEETESLPLNESLGPTRAVIRDGPYAYARILPKRWPTQVPFGAEHNKLMGIVSGMGWEFTTGGFLTYETESRQHGFSTLSNMTMQFRKTGELWAVNPRVSRQDGLTQWFFPNEVLQNWASFLIRQSKMMDSEFGQQYRIKLGVSPLAGLSIATGGYPDRVQAIEEQFEFNAELIDGSPEQIEIVLLDAWNELMAAFGKYPYTKTEFEDIIRPSRGVFISQD
jgi:hypothetical protein